MNTRLYLVEEREEGSKYPDFQPFSKKVSIGKWRALKFANYIYLLSGIHSGYVYYFKPDNLTRRDPNDSLVVPLGVMSYGLYFLVILFATILLLCCIQQSCYGPALRRARRYPTINLKEVTRIIEDSPQMSLNLEQSLAYGYRRCRCFRMKYGHCRFESPADSVDDSSPTSTSSNTSKETNNSSSSSS
ncbi:hypothetical protein BLOT_000871 [Blomia tropicalis]|nr:hypothetical protein BLOT_000871 [Blomia tropicalis]